MLETYNEDLQAAIERYRTEISVGVFVSSHAERHGAASVAAVDFLSRCLTLSRNRLVVLCGDIVGLTRITHR